MKPAELVRQIRTEAGLTVRGLAEAAHVAASTVHRIEKGELAPTVTMLSNIAEAAGMRLRLEPYSDYATSLVGLARAISEDLEQDRPSWPVRRSAELVHRFQNADQERQHRMVAATPPPTGDERWDAFVGGLAEWLAVRAGIPVPGWARGENRYLRYGWWITSMKSIRAWEYAGTPASLQSRGVYIHRDSLTNV